MVGNPPYGRVTLTPAQRQRFARGLYGHANLYGVFTDIAVRWTKKGGTIAYLTPTSFLSGHYYSALRELMAQEAPPAAIDFVHARRGVFEDVLQETLLAVGRSAAARLDARLSGSRVAAARSAQRAIRYFFFSVRVFGPSARAGSGAAGGTGGATAAAATAACDPAEASARTFSTMPKMVTMSWGSTLGKTG